MTEFSTIANKSYGINKAYTKALKAALRNPKEITYNGKTWTVEQKASPKTHFYDRFVHLLKMAFSEDYAKKFAQAVQVLSSALTEYNRTAALSESVKKKFINSSAKEKALYQETADQVESRLETLAVRIPEVNVEFNAKGDALSAYFEAHNSESPTTKKLRLQALREGIKIAPEKQEEFFVDRLRIEKKLEAIHAQLAEKGKLLHAKAGELEEKKRDHEIQDVFGAFNNLEDEVVFLSAEIEQLLLLRDKYNTEITSAFPKHLHAIADLKTWFADQAEAIQNLEKELAHDPTYVELRKECDAVSEKLQVLIKEQEELMALLPKIQASQHRVEKQIEEFVTKQIADHTFQQCDQLTRQLFKDASEEEIAELHIDTSTHDFLGIDTADMHASALEKLKLLQSQVKTLIELNSDIKVNQEFFQILYDPKVATDEVLLWVKNDNAAWEIVQPTTE